MSLKLEQLGERLGFRVLIKRKINRWLIEWRRRERQMLLSWKQRFWCGDVVARRPLCTGQPYSTSTYPRCTFRAPTPERRRRISKTLVEDCVQRHLAIWGRFLHSEPNVGLATAEAYQDLITNLKKWLGSTKNRWSGLTDFTSKILTLFF